MSGPRLSLSPGRNAVSETGPSLTHVCGWSAFTTVRCSLTTIIACRGSTLSARTRTVQLPSVPSKCLPNPSRIVGSPQCSGGSNTNGVENLVYDWVRASGLAKLVCISKSSCTRRSDGVSDGHSSSLTQTCDDKMQLNVQGIYVAKTIRSKSVRLTALALGHTQTRSMGTARKIGLCRS